MTMSSKSATRPTLYFLSLAHGLHDFFTGAWVLVLAAQKIQLDLSYTQAGVAQAVYTLASAIAQPSFGAYFDRTGKPYRAVWMVAFTTIMVTLACFAPSYALFLLAGMGAGLGSAAFHAAGLSNAAQLAAGRGIGRATAIFLLGGNGGFAMGAYVGGMMIDHFGLNSLTLPALIFVFATPALIRLLRPYLEGLINEPERTTRQVLFGGRAVWIPILIFISVVAANQAHQGGFSTYLPQYYEAQGNTLGYAGTFTAIYLLFAAIGSFFGGMLSDHLPREWLAAGALALLAPLSYVILRADGIPLILASVVLGLCSNIPLPILLIIGQEVLPGGRSGASAYSFGLTFLTRAVATPIIGVIADATTLKDTLTWLGLLPLALAFLVFLLPRRAANLNAL